MGTDLICSAAPRFERSMAKGFAIFGVFAGALLVGGRAEAAPLTGSITLTQSLAVCPNADCLVPVNGFGAMVALRSATALDSTIVAAPTPNVAEPMTIDDASGNFVGQVGPGAIRDFCFVTVNCGIFPGAPVALWDSGAGRLTLDVNTVPVGLEANNTLVLGGTDLFHLAGFDDTPETSNLSVTRTGEAFSFSATDAAVPAAVHEPGFMVLFGSGLLGLGAVLRRRSGK